MTLIFYDTTDLPREICPILYKTKNGKWGVCSNRLFDDWFVYNTPLRSGPTYLKN